MTIAPRSIAAAFSATSRGARCGALYVLVGIGATFAVEAKAHCELSRDDLLVRALTYEIDLAEKPSEKSILSDLRKTKNFDVCCSLSKAEQSNLAYIFGMTPLIDIQIQYNGHESNITVDGCGNVIERFSIYNQ